jgi:large subunit ribosomal protein L21e
MVKRNRGKRGGHSRSQLSKHREKTTVNQILTQYETGDRVIIDIDSSTQAAMPHPRYQGNEGVVAAKRGDCYEVTIKDGGKEKTLVCGTPHLKKA